MKSTTALFIFLASCLVSIGQNQVFVVCADSSLYSLNVSNCSSTLVGYTPFALYDIAYNPTDQEYYGMGEDRWLYKLDPLTGNTTRVGFRNYFTINSLTFDEYGILYAMGPRSDSLYTINLTTGLTTNLGSTETGVFSAGDLTFRQGQLYLSGIPNQLVLINHEAPSNSVALGPFLSLNRVFGLTSIGCDQMYAFVDNDMYLLNQNNLLQSSQQCLNISPSDIYGAAAETELFGSIQVNLGVDTSLCTGATHTLDATTPNSTYLWQDGSNNSTFTASQPGLYWVEVNYNELCSVRDSINIGYYPQLPTDLGVDTSLCHQDTLLLTINSINSNYLWQDGTNNPSFTVKQAGEYWVEVTDSNLCSTRDTIRVNYSPPLSVSLGKDTTLCHNETLLLDVSSPNITYRWNDGSVAPTLTVRQSGEYWVEIANSKQCTARDTISVSYSPLLLAGFGPDTNLCHKDSLLLDASTTNATYLWQNGSTGPTFIVSAPGKYSVKVEDNNTCIATDTILVSYSPSLLVNLGKDTSLCYRDTLLLSAGNSNYSYQWQDNSTDPIFTVTSSGKYSVKVIDKNCFSSDTIAVSILPSVVLDLGLDQKICDNETLLLNAVSNNASYVWQDGSTDALFEVSEPGIYTVTVTSECETKSDTIEVMRDPCDCTVYVPNSFTPNGDRLNDEFIPKFDCDFLTYKFQVFNRWGEKLFETIDPYLGWDGTFQNENVKTGSYVYFLVYESESGSKDRITGSMTLIR